MGKSGTFDTETGELASQAGEFLAGVLALTRISRVTVALESGHGAGAALLSAARLTGHAETCLLFDAWQDDPLAALSAALLETDSETTHPTGLTVAQLLHAIQTRRRQSFLIIFDHFERYLAQGADAMSASAFDRAFVQLATDSQLDLHLLLVLDEAAEQGLERYQDAIPGLGDGCLRMPAGSPGMAQSASSLPEASQAARRDRSFGMLLERLTAIAPADDTAARQQQSAQAFEDDTSIDASINAAFNQPLPFEDVRPDRADVPPDAPEPVPEEPRITEVFHTEAPRPAPVVPVESAVEASQDPAWEPEEKTVLNVAAKPMAPAASPAPAPVAEPRRSSKSLLVALSAVLAVGAGIFAYRQKAPVAPDAPAAAVTADKPATAVQAAPPSTPPPAANPAPALMSAPALAEAATAKDVPAASGTAASAARPAPVVHVHVRSQRDRDRLQALTSKLAAQGIRVLDVKVMSKGPSVADLRYFRDEDRDEALAVQKAFKAAGVPVPRLSRMNGFENITRPRQFEAWLNDDGKPEPARR